MSVDRPRAQCAFIGLLLVTVVCGCSKAKTPATTNQTTSTAPQQAKAKPTPMPPQSGVPQGNVTSTPSEHIATGKPVRAAIASNDDGTAKPVYHGNPQIELDSKTLGDVRATIEQTCQLLEEGVSLLEKYKKTPEKAAKALNAYRDKNAARIQRIFKDAADVKARLRSVGYDQDIPAEVRPEFEKRMGVIQGRLEKMRTTYAKHRDVLEAFGQLFPR